MLTGASPHRPWMRPLIAVRQFASFPCYGIGGVYYVFTEGNWYKCFLSVGVTFILSASLGLVLGYIKLQQKEVL